MIPKSLRTVSVLVALAKHLHAAKPDFPIETCLFKALDILGYIDTPDTHGLVAQALKMASVKRCNIVNSSTGH